MYQDGILVDSGVLDVSAEEESCSSGGAEAINVDEIFTGPTVHMPITGASTSSGSSCPCCEVS